MIGLIEFIHDDVQYNYVLSCIYLHNFKLDDYSVI